MIELILGVFIGYIFRDYIKIAVKEIKKLIDIEGYNG